MNNKCACLYIDCGQNEYLIRVYEGFYRNTENRTQIQDHDSNWTNNLEMYKLYNAKDFLNVVSEDTNEMNAPKPTFSAEAESLQSEGLLKGNENGLDLLKPLTRIEAAAMLLRAMGESEDADNGIQVFTDVPNTHWGFGAAENAYNLGLIKGVGDDMFAPEENVTAEQFATMVLRAAGSSEFDWEQAVNILIEKGVITQENASTMDLFTRGDMAKIIYEAKQNALL